MNRTPDLRRRECCERTTANWPVAGHHDDSPMIDSSQHRKNSDLQSNKSQTKTPQSRYASRSSKGPKDDSENEIPSAPYWLVLLSVNTNENTLQDEVDNKWSVVCPDLVDTADIWDIVQKKTNIRI